MRGVWIALLLAHGWAAASEAASNTTAASSASTDAGSCDKPLSGGDGFSDGADAGIGALIAVLASVVSNVGVNVQKQAHVVLSTRPADERVPYTRMPLWWMGMACVVGGSLGDFAALAFATQALVASLGGATTLATNLVIARFWHKEELIRQDVFGVAGIIAGAIIIATKTPNTNNYELQDMQVCAQKAEFVIYLAVLGLVLLSLLSSVATSSLYQWKKTAIAALLRPMTRRVDRMAEAEGFLFGQLRALRREHAELLAALREREIELGITLPLDRRSAAAKRAGGGGGGGAAAAQGLLKDVTAVAVADDAGADAGDADSSDGEPMLAMQADAALRNGDGSDGGDSDGGTRPVAPRDAVREEAQSQLLRSRVAHEYGQRRARDFDVRGCSDSTIRTYWSALQNPDDSAEARRYSRWSDAFIYAACAGAIGSISVLLAGLVAKIVAFEFSSDHAQDEKDHQFESPALYLFVVGMVASITWQTSFLNRALRMADVSTCYPVFQGFWIAFGVLGGLIFYEQAHLVLLHDGDMKTPNWPNIVLYLLAAVLMMGGCFMLSSHGKSEFERRRREQSGLTFGAVLSFGNEAPAPPTATQSSGHAGDDTARSANMKEPLLQQD